MMPTRANAERKRIRSALLFTVRSSVEGRVSSVEGGGGAVFFSLTGFDWFFPIAKFEMRNGPPFTYGFRCRVFQSASNQSGTRLRETCRRQSSCQFCLFIPTDP